MKYPSTKQILTGLSWVGTIFALLGSWYISGGNPVGWWSYLIADVLLMGIQIYNKTWSQALLFLCFIALSVRGIVHSGLY